MWEAVAAIAGFLTAIAGLTRWLFSVWFKNVKENEILKNELRSKEIESIHVMLENFETKLKYHQTQMVELQRIIQIQTQEFEEAKAGYVRIGNNLRQFIIQSEQVTKELKQNIVRISDDLMIIKGKPRAQKN